MSMLDIESLDDFLDEIPTNPCGEGGCRDCDMAYHMACDPILYLSKHPITDASVHVDFAEEEDTNLDITPVPFFEEQEYHELGGEG